MAKRNKSKFHIAVINKVTEIRHQKGLSQIDLAAILDKTRGFIGQVESPKSPSKYNLDHLNKLAFEMGCSPKDFLPDEPVPEKDWE